LSPICATSIWFSLIWLAEKHFVTITLMKFLVTQFCPVSSHFLLGLSICYRKSWHYVLSLQWNTKFGIHKSYRKIYWHYVLSLQWNTKFSIHKSYKKSTAIT
jgi:hypothetical protein